jgi:hypothetical protein
LPKEYSQILFAFAGSWRFDWLGAATPIRSAAREPGFLAGVLEHMLGDASLLIAFATSVGIDPAEVTGGALGRKWERDVP